MNISTKQNQHLRRLAHHLKPVIIIGNAGLTDSVLEEIKLALGHHELIKVKINAGDRLERKEISEHIITNCDCHHVQSIGRISVYYKSSEAKKISLPK